MIYYERWGFIYSAGLYLYFERANLISFVRLVMKALKDKDLPIQY